MRTRQKSQFVKRLRLHEALESRCLLAGVTADSPWQNPMDPTDVDLDGRLTASDVLMDINALNAQGSGDLHAKFAPMMLAGEVKGAAAGFLDTSGDGQLSAIDPLMIINAINAGLHLGWGNDVSATDGQIGVVGSAAQNIDISNGFAKVRSAINTDGDVDVFQVTPTKAQLNISLISGASGVLHISVQTINADSGTAGTVATTEVGTAATQSDSHQPAKINVNVTAGTTYYVVVSGDAGVTGAYALALLNYDMGDFTPVTDSPLGTDSHGNTTATATVLTLSHSHAEVTSNIDPVAADADPDKDLFQITAVDGKLAVTASAEYPLTVSILDSTGAVKGTINSSDHVALVLDATAGTYYVSVAAANATDTGAYHLTVVNAAIPSLPGLGHGLPPQIPTADAIFARLDANGKDGISLTEWEAGVPLGHTRIADAIFNKLDTNDDGSVSVDEFMAGLAKLHLPGLLGGHADDDHMDLPPVVTSR